VRPDAFMEKAGIRIAVIAFTSFASPAGASAPRVAAAYGLRAPRAPATFVATAGSPAGDALAVFIWPTFEGEPHPGTVALLRGEGAPLELNAVWSAALDESWSRLAVGEQVEVVDNTLEPPFSRANLLCRELSMDGASLERSLYYDGFAGNGYVTRPVIYDLESDAREALPLAGGDFIDWADESRLVIGRETGTAKSPGVSALELYGYNLETRALTRLAGVDEAADKLGEKLSGDVRDSPYLSAAWRLAPTPGVWKNRYAEKVAVPARGGSFENGGNGFSWRPDGGEPAFVAKGAIVAASGDGSWVVTYGGDEGGGLTAYRLAWR
jgi:hypothetical protein